MTRPESSDAARPTASSETTADPAVVGAGGRSSSLILDLFGLYVRRFDGWIAVAALVALMSDLGVDEGPTRSALSRMVRKGLLERHEVDGIKGYRVAASAEARMVRADRRIMGPFEPAPIDEGWTIITASIPENNRRSRDRLRDQLRRIGCGSLGNAVWLIPRRATDDLWATLTEAGLDQVVTVFAGDYLGARDLDDVVDAAWDLDALEELYTGFIATCEDILDRWPTAPAGADVGAFVDYTDAVHAWRKFPYLDPGLPAELLPQRWSGAVAADRFTRIGRRLEASALGYVGQVMAANSAQNRSQ